MMRALLLTTLCASLALAGCGQPVPTSAPLPTTTTDWQLDQVDPEHSRDILLRVKPGQPLKLPSDLPIEHQESLSVASGIYAVRIPVGTSLTAALNRLAQMPGMAYVEPNYRYQLPPHQVSEIPAGFGTRALTPNDPQFGLQWNIRSAKIDQAWELSTGSNTVTVAVIDSGVDPNHPDLKERLLPLEDVWDEETGSDRVVSRITGEQVDFKGRDGNGHGTHVAGVIGAILNNNTGLAGVAGGGVKILPIKATSMLGATNARVLTAAVLRAIERGAKVINMSIGSTGRTPAANNQVLIDAVNEAVAQGITVISATGNESSRPRNVAAIAEPAIYDNVIAVGAHTEMDNVAVYSNGGPEIDLVAPGGGGSNPATAEGEQIWSTWPTYRTFESLQGRIRASSYVAISGTSMACPHVSGVAALLLSREPNLTPSQIRARLIASADDLGEPGFDQASGYGKLNAFRALSWSRHDTF
jgi:serine protease